MIPGLDGLMGAAGKMMEMIKGLESLNQGGQQGGGQGAGQAGGGKGGIDIEQLMKMLDGGEGASQDELKKRASGSEGLGKMLEQGDSKGSINTSSEA
ncbi:hypothetical protein [Pseudomonas sp. B22129]|uniref:hypothetical protein n=1 Tax=Pseudomonas sp. B22129 TaxID=3235111 RepID=UPI003783AB40